MYCTVREYTLKPNANLDDLVAKVRNQFLSIISKASGFAGYTLAANDRDLVTVGFFDGREGADESVDLARDWVRDNVSDAVEGPPHITSGEVLASARTSGEAHYGVLRRMKTQPGKRADLLKLMATKLLPLLKEQPGFLPGSIVDAGDDELLVVGAYTNRKASEDATAVAMGFMQQNAMQFLTGPPKMTDLDIKLRHVNEPAFAG